jgi:RNA polymerase sigma-70 factor (ECF subfamily)
MDGDSPGMAIKGMGDVTQMLVSYGNGDRAVLDALLPLVYDELRVIEAYLRLINQQRVDWRNRAQFFGLAAHMMRRILVNHAESRGAQKRGGGMNKVPLDEVAVVFEEEPLDLLALNEALLQLATMDKLKSEIVEMKFFGGLTIDEIAEVTKMSTASVEREWAFARGWLFKTLTEKQESR